VISTFVAGIPELVEPGVCGWLVPAGSAKALVEAMRDALRASPQQLAAMGEAGAARVAAQHHADHEAARLAQLFQGAVGSLPIRTATMAGDSLPAPVA
jgi:glycosyltransferase involved in cell wall biosynthesis